MKIYRLIPVLIIALVLIGCSFTVNVPEVKTGATETASINSAYPEAISNPILHINMGAGTLNISGGSSQMVEGEVRYNVADWAPSVKMVTDGLTLSQKETKNIGVPSGNIINDWTLKLGDRPMGLQISAGAYSGTLDLSGVPLTSLEVNDGASKSTVTFGSENPAQMESLVYKTGASQVDIKGIGYANVKEVSFNGGAGAYSLDFTGSLKNDIACSIKTGVSDVKLVFPQGGHVIVTVNGGLGNVNANGTWTINGTTYETGSGSPSINVTIEMAVGNLTLTTRLSLIHI